MMKSNLTIEKELSQKVGASQLDTLTTEQLDALIQLARYGLIHGGHCAKCVKRLLFPLEGELIGK